MEVKKELVDIIVDYFADQRERKNELLANEDKVNDLMNLGKRKAQKIASDTLSNVKQATGLL
jgi:tryptophanyl-tRNA synthetase